MAEKLDAIGGKLEKAAGGALMVLCICIFCALTFYSARYTVAENGAIPLDTKDNAGWNLLGLAGVTTAAILVHRIAKSKYLQVIRQCVRKRKPYLIGMVSIYVYVVSAIWVSDCHVIPYGDSGVLFSIARKMLGGYYIDMESPGCYMTVFPHQFSLVAVIQVIMALFGPENHKAFQYLNALCMPLLFYSGYKILQYICEDLETVFYYILFFLGCFPLFLYVPFVYGEIISITFTMVLMWQVIRYCKTDRKPPFRKFRHSARSAVNGTFLWGTFAIVLACMVRKNSLIVLVAAGIVLLFHSARKADPRGVIWILVMALAVSGSDKLVCTYYEKMSGTEVSGGIPYISWIRMGLQDTWAGPGWFDNSSVDHFAENGFDTDRTALAEKRLLRETLEDMWEDKSGSVDFFRRKILSQWNSPGYNYGQTTKNFDCGPEEFPAFVRYVYFEGEKTVQAYMDRYQSVFYFYVAASAVALFADRKKKYCLADLLLYIAMVGGFLFSIMWEACSRYVLPYIVYMIPMAALGMHRLVKFLDRFGSSKRNKRTA